MHSKYFYINNVTIKKTRKTLSKKAFLARMARGRARKGHAGKAYPRVGIAGKRYPRVGMAGVQPFHLRVG